MIWSHLLLLPCYMPHSPLSMWFSHSGLLLFLPELQVSSCLRAFALASRLLRMLWPALSHLLPLQPNVTPPKRLPYLCKGASPPSRLPLFASLYLALIKTISCIYLLVCLFVSQFQNKNSGREGTSFRTL